MACTNKLFLKQLIKFILASHKVGIILHSYGMKQNIICVTYFIVIPYFKFHQNLLRLET